VDLESSVETLAIHGGTPVRESVLPYGRQWVDEEDIEAVVRVMQSDFLTTGPEVAEFEQAFAVFSGAVEAVAVSSGTAALHAMMYGIGIGPGDEVIVPALTFVASANCVLFQGGTPILADIHPETLLMDPDRIEEKITSRTKAILAVDFAGRPSDYDALREISNRSGLRLVSDACHAFGATRHGQKVGTLADATAFSLHPVKHMTAGEGGLVTTNDPDLASRMRIFRNHGITTDHRQREAKGSWFYEMADLGYNYRLTDIQCALGKSQLRKLPDWVSRRQEIAGVYDAAFRDLAEIETPATQADVSHAYHLYAIQLELSRLSCTRAEVFSALRAEGIGVNVHYIPVHLHPYYRQRFDYRAGDIPYAEAAYERLISLPIFPRMKDTDVEDVIRAVGKVLSHYKK